MKNGYCKRVALKKIIVKNIMTINCVNRAQLRIVFLKSMKKCILKPAKGVAKSASTKLLYFIHHLYQQMFLIVKCNFFYGFKFF